MPLWLNDHNSGSGPTVANEKPEAPNGGRASISRKKLRSYSTMPASSGQRRVAATLRDALAHAGHVISDDGAVCLRAQGVFALGGNFVIAAARLHSAGSYFATIR